MSRLEFTKMVPEIWGVRVVYINLNSAKNVQEEDVRSFLTEKRAREVLKQYNYNRSPAVATLVRATLKWETVSPRKYVLIGYYRSGLEYCRQHNINPRDALFVTTADGWQKMRGLDGKDIHIVRLYGATTTWNLTEQIDWLISRGATHERWDW